MWRWGGARLVRRCIENQAALVSVELARFCHEDDTHLGNQAASSNIGQFNVPTEVGNIILCIGTQLSDGTSEPFDLIGSKNLLLQVDHVKYLP